MMVKNFHLVNDLIDKSKNVVLTTHLIPDGDAIGSVLAMSEFIKVKGKEAVIINHSPTPDNYSFLDLQKQIRVFKENKEENITLINNADLIFILDTNELSRVKSLETHIRNSGAKKICIDHHMGLNGNNFDVIVSDTTVPATAEILYDYFYKNNPDFINKKIAEYLYVGIMTDTGSFRYPRTTEKTFLICADLIKRGVDPVMIYEKVYCNISISKVKLLARFIESLTMHYDNKLVIGIITEQDFKEFNADVQHVEGFSTFIMNIKNVVAGIVIVELPKSIKLSLRSKGDIKMNEFAKEFNGGGHVNAAGVSLEKQDVYKVKKTLIESIKNYIN